MENSCLDRFQQALGGMAILTILIFLIQEHEISFYFFESSFISFIIFYGFHPIGFSLLCSGLLVSILFEGLYNFFEVLFVCIPFWIINS